MREKTGANPDFCVLSPESLWGGGGEREKERKKERKKAWSGAVQGLRDEQEEARSLAQMK